MTYLDCPRFHFAGTFFSDPSTVNNERDHYNNDAFDRATEWVVDAGGWWNPDGRNSFRFENVTVRSALGSDGESAAGDPVVGLRFVTRGLVPAKLVDLDTDQQLVSTIFGLTLALVDAEGNVLVEGAMYPAPFTDLWARASVPGDGGLCAVYQSTLESVRWKDVAGSPLLEQLRDAAGDGALSIKSNVDGYMMSRTRPDGSPNPRFARGRIVGTVGAAAVGEPRHTVIGRQFGTEGSTDRINFFPGAVDLAARTVRLDLGNALPTATAGGPMEDLGELVLACRAADGTVTEIAPIDYRGPSWYETTAGVVDLPADRALTDHEAARVAADQLLLIARPDGQAPLTVEEAPVHVRADEFVARLDPGDGWVVHLYVTQGGRPLPGARVNLSLVIPQAPPEAATQFPRGGLTFPGSVATDSEGVAKVTLTAADPGNPRFFYGRGGGLREHVDGQVYRIDYAVDGVTPPNPWNILSVLVWNTFTPDDPPTWHGSMRKVLMQYGNLYPWMSEFGPRLDLAVYDQIAAQREDIVAALDRAVTDPRYMPVSRDMSMGRRKAMLTWLTNLGSDGMPLLGEAPAPGAVEEVAPTAPSPAVARTAEPEAHLGGKTAAMHGLGMAPR